MQKTHSPKLQPASTSFEQQVHRIQELLSTSDAHVTWNDHVPDPDSEGRTRQVDVTVRRGDHLTLIECRSHKEPQDVTWIEELMGRRQSLQANAVVAVSSSGFTRGAVSKAAAHCVALRDLRKLTDREISAWGRSIGLTLYFFQYQNITLSLGFSLADIRKTDRRALEAALRGHPLLVTVFNAAARLVGEQLIPGTEAQNLAVDFGVRGAFEDVTVCAQQVLEARLEGQARLLSQRVTCPVVSGYGGPMTAAVRREAMIQTFDLGDTSIVHDGDRIALHLDLSLVKAPALSQFRYVATEGDHEVDVETFSLVGLERLNVQDGTISVKLFTFPDPPDPQRMYC